MSSVTYTAKRKIIELGVTAVGTDISFDTTDDSINSVTTDLSGFSNGEWVKVVGSTSNDGWHQVSGESTTTKIVTLSNLTTEAAGDSVSLTGYLHGLGEAYTIDFGSRAIENSITAETNESITIGGVIESIFLRQNDFWDVTSGLIARADKKYWDEFFGSVMAREIFSFDAYGTSGSPDNPINVTLDEVPKIQREAMSDYFRMSFKVREV